MGAYHWQSRKGKNDQGGDCGIETVGNAQPWAQVIAEEYFASLGPLEIGTAPESFDNPAPLGIAHKEESSLKSIDWVGRGQDRAVSKVPWLCIGPTQSGIADLGLLALCLVSAIAALGATGVGSISGVLARNRWQPCEHKVSQAFKKIDVRAVVREALSCGLEAQGLSPTIDLAGNRGAFEQVAKSALKSIMKARFGNFHFRETHKEFFLAADMDAILWDVVNDKSLRAWSLSAKDVGWPNEKSHSLAALCEGDTDTLVRSDISRLLEAFVRRIGQDIKTAVQGNSNTKPPPLAVRKGKIGVIGVTQ